MITNFCDLSHHTKNKKLSFKNFKKIKIMRDSFNITVNIRFPRCVISMNMRMISSKQVVIITPPRKESAPRSTLKRYVFT